MKKQSDLAAPAEQAALTTPKAETAPAAHHGAGKPAEVIIHVRFHPTGLVNTINQRPEHISPQEWFDRLCRAAPLSYQPLSGGRAAFRISSEAFEVILRDNAA
jgi:hypothetical protein